MFSWCWKPKRWSPKLSWKPRVAEESSTYMKSVHNATTVSRESSLPGTYTEDGRSSSYFPLPSDKKILEQALHIFFRKNPIFVEEYLLNRVSASTIERWIINLKKNIKPEEDFSKIFLSLSQDPQMNRKLQQMMSIRKRMIFPVNPEFLEAEKILKNVSLIEENPPLDIDNFRFDTSTVEPDNMSCVIFYIFETLFGRFAFSRERLAYFIVMVEKNYGNTKYHNYTHALNHVQSMFWILRESEKVFTQLEMKALMVASLCHDVSHPGLTEEFIKDIIPGILDVDEPLLETFHVRTTVLILMDENVDLFPEANPNEITSVIDDIKYGILSTHLKHYPILVKKIQDLTSGKKFDFKDRRSRNCAKHLLMVMCDLASCWAEWRQHLVLVYHLMFEFYDQGTVAKAIGLDNPDYMDRKNIAMVPNFEACFLDNLAIPVMKEAPKIFPVLQIVLEATQVNRKLWKKHSNV